MSNTVAKSFENSGDPIINYCCGLTVVQHPLQKELQKETLDKAELAMMLGAPEILTIGSHFLELIGGKKVIDIGTYTGASALAWALAIPDGGKVYTLDVDHKNFKKHGLPILKKCAKTMEKIEAVEAPALETLARLLADGEKGTFDFAFIDADKPNYTNYYNRCVELLRPGGVILVDNVSFPGRASSGQSGCTPARSSIVLSPASVKSRKYRGIKAPQFYNSMG